MKKNILRTIILIVCLVAVLSIVKVVIKSREAKWHVEITNIYINIRSEANTYSKVLDQVKRGEKYQVIKMEQDDTYYWYYIKINSFKKGWIASSKKSSYLKDYNNPNDLVAPVVKYYESVYHAESINDINYKHLEIIDNTECEISHIVYYEKEQNQYWITYIVKDKGNNETRKTQQIEFDKQPLMSEVKEWK